MIFINKLNKISLNLFALMLPSLAAVGNLISVNNSAELLSRVVALIDCNYFMELVVQT